MDISRLRNALKKLRRVDFDTSNGAHVAMAPQEILDFLAMLEGTKPVYLLGRGFDDTDWIAGIKQIAEAMGLRMIEGNGWITAEDISARPTWYVEMQEAHNTDDRKYSYICKAQVVATKLRQLSDLDSVTCEDEAQLLGYPICCVTHYHQRQKAFDEMFFGKIYRAANGDVGEMRRIVRDDDQFTADNPEEEELFRSKLEIRPAPFTSFNMCPSCFADACGPARQISKKYELLASKVDPELAAEIAYYQAPMIASSQ